MTSPRYRMGRLALAAGTLTLVALFGTAGLAAAATAPSQSATAANHPMRSMPDCPPACCKNPLCCDPLCCNGTPGMADMTALQRLATTSAKRSDSCGCRNSEHRATAAPAAPVADNDSLSCAACCDTSHNAG